MLFAILQGFVSSTNAMAGYLEEEKHLGKDTKMHKQMIHASVSQVKNIRLLDQLYRLTTLTNLHIQNIHIEQLMNKISVISSIQMSSQSTYVSSLVGVDEEAFCQCVIGIILACGPSKNFTTESRRRGKHLVISIFAKKNQWIQHNIHSVIRSFQATVNTQNKYKLDELVVIYALSVLHGLGIEVSSRRLHSQDRIYMHIPVSQQLNVFDTDLVTE